MAKLVLARLLWTTRVPLTQHLMLVRYRPRFLGSQQVLVVCRMTHGALPKKAYRWWPYKGPSLIVALLPPQVM